MGPWATTESAVTIFPGPVVAILPALRLAQRLVEDDPHRRRQVQTADLPRRHRNGDPRLPEAVANRGREAMPFVPEEQDIAILVGDAGIVLRGRIIDGPDPGARHGE